MKTLVLPKEKLSLEYDYIINQYDEALRYSLESNMKDTNGPIISIYRNKTIELYNNGHIFIMDRDLLKVIEEKDVDKEINPLDYLINRLKEINEGNLFLRISSRVESVDVKGLDNRLKRLLEIIANANIATLTINKFGKNYISILRRKGFNVREIVLIEEFGTINPDLNKAIKEELYK